MTYTYSEEKHIRQKFFERLTFELKVDEFMPEKYYDAIDCAMNHIFGTPWKDAVHLNEQIKRFYELGKKISRELCGEYVKGPELDYSYFNFSK